MLHAVIGVNGVLVDPVQLDLFNAAAGLSIGFHLSTDAGTVQRAPAPAVQRKNRKLRLCESNQPCSAFPKREPNPKLDRSESRGKASHQSLTDQDYHRGDNEKGAQ